MNDITTGDNLQDYKDAINEAFDKIDGFEAERSAINANIAAVWKNLEAKGLNKKAMVAARAFLGLDPEDRPVFDTSLQIALEAKGMPLQSEFTFASKGDDGDPEDVGVITDDDPLGINDDEADPTDEDTGDTDPDEPFGDAA